MKKLINNVFDRWTPDKFSNDLRKNTDLLFYFTLIATFTTLFCSGYVVLVIENNVMAIRMLILGSFFVCPLIIHVRTGNFTIAANFFVFIFFAIVVSIILIAKKYPGHLFFWFQVPMLMSGLLVGKKWVCFWGVVCILFTLGYCFTGGTFKPAADTSDAIIRSLHLLSILGISVVCLVLVYLYANIIDKNINNLTKKNEENRNLLQLVAHDVINPLMIIYTTVKFVTKHGEPLNEKDKKAWGKIERASETMKNILDQVRKMHAVESGKVQLKLEPVNVIQSVKNSSFLFTEKLESKNVKIVYEECNENIYVMADVVTFGNQVISNLLSNAIKFSNNGGRIIVRIKKESENKDMVHLQFVDNGIGMPENIVKKIFDSSEHTSRLGTDGETGTGFGMPLVKTYIDKYGGSISVESKSIDDFPENHGTTFDIHLKRATIFEC